MVPQREPSKLLEEVAFRNNEAVFLMELGDYVSAAIILKDTIDVMQCHHDCLKGKLGDDDEDLFIDLDVPADSICKLSMHLPSTQAVREQTPIAMFDRAFFLDQREMSAHGSMFEARQFCLIILFFNMALCLHIQAYMAHTRQDEFFAQVVTLYQMACGLHESSSDERLILLLQLALSNNLACVHAHYCDMLETRRWLDEVHFICLLNAKRLNREEWTLFSTNLLANEHAQNRSSPAA